LTDLFQNKGPKTLLMSLICTFPIDCMNYSRQQSQVLIIIIHH